MRKNTRSPAPAASTRAACGSHADRRSVRIRSRCFWTENTHPRLERAFSQAWLRALEGGACTGTDMAHGASMTTLIYGDRLGRWATVALACSAVVFDDERRLLLTRRVDNRKWCLPGGHFEAGETVTEALVREVKEETGLNVEVIRLTGVDSNPHRVVEYPDGHRFHIGALNFEARVIGGELAASDETSEFMWCPYGEVGSLDIVESHIERIDDAVNRNCAAYVR
jgi:ADP-ribose pyrophosphatase YjhB (NUDIX family)